MRRSAMKRRFKGTGPAPADVEALRGRSGGWCEMQLHGCLGRATEVSHRGAKGMGGRKGEARERNNGLSNVVHGCRECHAWIHARPAEAYELGLMLRQWQDPEQEPVVRRGVLVLLHDDGTWTEVAL